MDDRPDHEAGLTALEQRLGYSFADPALLGRAVQHRSWCAEHPGSLSNERLEFLGDAVLGWMVAEIVYQLDGELSEGHLTDLRKAVVNATALAEIARELGIGKAVALGKGEAAAGGRDKTSILADALEAVIGAVYLDGGAEAVDGVFSSLLESRIAAALGTLGRLDHKTQLQEIAASKYDAVPLYEITEAGPDHAKVFFASVSINGEPFGEGEGRSKKAAEQAAAESALEALQTPDPD
ncbi:MAG: ribonuclease III [Acidimicrobiia bacterium]